MSTEFSFKPRSYDVEKRIGRPPKHESIEPGAWVQAGAYMSMVSSIARELLMREDRVPVLRLVAEHDSREVVRTRARARLRLLDGGLSQDQTVKSAPQVELWQCTHKECQHIGPPADFGTRRMGGKVKRQAWCKRCRSEAGRLSRERKKAQAAGPLR